MAGRAQIWLTWCGSAPAPAELALRWNWDPWLLAAMAVAAAGHVLLTPRERTRDAAFAGLVLAVLVLFVSPFCALSAALFTARVVHHLALVFVAAPLIVILWGGALQRIAGSLAVWTAVQALVFWMWHAPALYAGALSHDGLFWAMQLSIALSSAVWWAKLMRAPAAGAVASLLVAMVLMGLLGALLTFVPRPIYEPHLLTTHPWGFTPLEDQQIGGVVMWAPGSLIYLLAAMAILFRKLFRMPSAETVR